MLKTAQVMAIGAIVAFVGGILVGTTALWFWIGGSLMIAALVISRGRIISREPPSIVDLVDPADGAEPDTSSYSHVEAAATLGDRGGERAKL